MDENRSARRRRPRQDGHLSHPRDVSPGRRISLPDRMRKEFEETQKAFVQEPMSSGVWAHWWQLLRSADEAYGLNNIDITDVRFLLSWSSAVAIREGDHRKAVDLLRAYFQHPDVDDADYWLNISMRCYLAESLLFAEEEQQAANVFRLILEVQDRRLPRVIIERLRNSLRDYCATRPSSSAASTPLDNVIYDVVGRLSRRGTPTQRPDERTTYAELRNLLETTLPDPPRERRQHDPKAGSDDPSS